MRPTPEIISTGAIDTGPLWFDGVTGALVMATNASPTNACTLSVQVFVAGAWQTVATVSIPANTIVPKRVGWGPGCTAAGDIAQCLPQQLRLQLTATADAAQRSLCVDAH